MARVGGGGGHCFGVKGGARLLGSVEEHLSFHPGFHKMLGRGGELSTRRYKERQDFRLGSKTVVGLATADQKEKQKSQT